MRKPRVLILHNQVAPYRLPLFERMKKNFDITVYFCELKSRDRMWKTGLLSKFTFNWKVLEGLRVGSIILNTPTLLIKALRGWDAYLIADNVENIPATWMVAIASKISGKPLIVWSEKIDSPWNREVVGRSFLKRAVLKVHEKALFSLADVIVAYSKKARKYLMKRGVFLGKIVQGMQVMPEEVLPREDCAGIEERLRRYRRTILYLGYLRPEKGVEQLIESFVSADVDACLLIVGTGPLKERLEREYSSSEKVVFYGYAGENEKPCLYRMAEFLVLPTLRDSWGLVVNEALYYGTPVITTTAAGASMLIENEKTGFVIKAGDWEALKELLEELTSNPKTLRKMRRLAKKSGKRYSESAFGARAFIKALEKALVNPK
ncbi:glycosyltransferase family 4 protein [Thermococcus sp.]|uniref:glycosyltransferase family 4 protein n=1 Tax=Thermococcus sp. TaxID=35749 RepID=UPI0026261D44|nr:glycosyltransferase family 4 protein [Thermococcus sp.]